MIDQSSVDSQLIVANVWSTVNTSWGYTFWGIVYNED